MRLYVEKRAGLKTEEASDFEYSLRGKDWNVYWILLRNGQPMSVREVQKALRFSSPSVAQHHLEQLRQLGLVQKQDVGGSYFLVNEVKIGVLRHFVKLGRLIFPRYFFYAVFSTASYITYLLVFLSDITRESIFIILFGAIICAIFWFEAARVWSLKPF